MKKLRILVVSNYYPPHSIGGYELGCRDVVESLKRRGHEVRILTSAYNLERPQDDGEVYRRLLTLPTWEPVPRHGLFKLLQREILNRRVCKRLCADFDPELIYVWNPAGISLSFIFSGQGPKVPVCYFVSDHWLAELDSDFGYGMWSYQDPRPLRRALWKTMLSVVNWSRVLPRPQTPNLRHVQFASQFLKAAALRNGMPVADAEVIHWGIDTARFACQIGLKSPLRLLYVGQLMKHKGVHTAVAALKILKERSEFASATLTIAGGGVDAVYEADLRRLVSSSGLDQSVRFTGVLPRDQLPPLYQDHAILIFPSIWEEPFSITVLEAMSSGLAVVGTPTGGSPEILRDGVNAFTFPPEDAERCATQILRLWREPQLLDAIRRHARQTVEREFQFENMVDIIERSLQHAAAGFLVG